MGIWEYGNRYGFDRNYDNIHWNMGIYISYPTHILRGMCEHWCIDPSLNMGLPENMGICMDLIGNIYWNMGIYIFYQTHVLRGMYEHWCIDPSLNMGLTGNMGIWENVWV